MNPHLNELLAKAEQSIYHPMHQDYRGRIHVGVDLGTAYTVIMVLDEAMQPLVGAYEYAEVVREGVVVDFMGASMLVRKLKRQVEEKLGMELTRAATSYPPGVPQPEVRANRYILESANLEVSHLVDEPTAANAVLQVENGAVVDIGGGTTGIAIIRDGKVIFTADEPTGGTQFSLVIAGAFKIPFQEAEAMKLRREEQSTLFPRVLPVMEKIASIINYHTFRFQVDHIYLVGGTSAFPGIANVIARETGIPTDVPVSPLFVTPLGVAMYDK
jgi:ethanolamine utilization protein EutJ